MRAKVQHVALPGLVVAALTNCAPATGEATPGAKAEIRQPAAIRDSVVQDLEWTFRVETLAEATAEDSPVYVAGLRRCTTHRYRSENPYEKDGQGGTVYLRFVLWECDYEDSGTAESALERFVKTADPDTGQTYSHDRVFVVRNRLYRLTAGCIFSDENVAKMAASLLASILTHDGANDAQPVLSASCRCGGGCRYDKESE